MEVGILVARVLHIVIGTFWVGSMVFITYYLMPAVGDVGPDGAKVMAALQRKGVLSVLPVAALLTIVSGLFLFDQMSGHFRGPWMGTPTGMAFGTGGLLAILGFLLAILVMRPATLRANALTASAAQLSEGPGRMAALEEAGRLRARAGRTARLVTPLLVVATALMAAARYL